MPAAAGERDVARANGLMETVRSLGFTAGPLVGGALGAAGLLRLALVDRRAVVRCRRGRRARCCGRGGGPARACGARRCAPATGFAFLAPRAATLAITLGGAVAALAVFTISVTAEPFFVTDVLGAGQPRLRRLLITAWTLGMAAGAAGLAHRVPRAGAGRRRARRGRRSRASGSPAPAPSPVLWTALIGFAFGGVAHGVKNVLLRTLIHERVPEALRGRAFAAYNGARNGAELGALALGGARRRRVRRPPGAARRRPRARADRPRLPASCSPPPIERRAIHARVQG